MIFSAKHFLVPRSLQWVANIVWRSHRPPCLWSRDALRVELGRQGRLPLLRNGSTEVRHERAFAGRTSFIGTYFAVLLLLLAASCTTALLAQNTDFNLRPSPRLAFAYPAGAQQGLKTTVSIGGQNLKDVTHIRFSGPGITARLVSYDRPLTQKEINDLREKIEPLKTKRTAKTPLTAEEQKELRELQTLLAKRANRQASPALAETVTIEVEIAADAAVGERSLRLQTPAGLSNPLVFIVGSLPEFTAPVVTATNQEPKRGKQMAGRPAATPPSEITVQLPVVVNGQILPGEVDRIRFTARKDQLLTIAANARGLIPYLADAVPGWFQATLTLHDAHGRELKNEDDISHRPDPMLACRIPADGDYVLEIKDSIYRGREDFIYRTTLGELPFIQSVFPLGTDRRETPTVELTGWNLTSLRVPIDQRKAPPGLGLLSVRQGDYQSNPIRFAVGDLPETSESETNSTALAAPLTTPVIINGQINPSDDRDVFAFQGRKGEMIVAEIFARRLGSPLDSALTLTDSAGRQLAFNDDYEDKSEGLLTHQADSRVTATLPHDGTYEVTVADTQHHGGPQFGYRLSLGASQPDFSLRVVPSAVNVPAGSSVPITVFALRRDGFAGEIHLALRDNSSNFRLSGARIPAGQDSVTLTITAPGSAKDKTEIIHLAGRATVGGKSVVHDAVAADDTMQAFLYRHLVPAGAWTVAVAGRSMPFRLIGTATTVRLERGAPTRIPLATPGLQRAIEDLKVELINPPAGLSIGACKARNGEIEFEVLCDPAQAKTGNTGNLIVVVSGQRPNRKEADKKNITRLGVAPAIPYVINPEERTRAPALP